MTRNSAKSSFPSAAALRIARQGFRLGLSLETVRREIKKQIGERVTLRMISEMHDGYHYEQDTKKHLKRKGAGLVDDFLKKAQGGEDVTELQSVLANAVYLDLLRRYAAADEGLEELPMKEMLKVVNDYQKHRLSLMKAGKGGKGLTAPQALVMLDNLIDELAEEAPSLGGVLRKMREFMRGHIARYYEEADFDAAVADHEVMQEIVENYEQAKAANGKK